VAPWGLGRLGWDHPLAQELIRRADPWIEVAIGCKAVLGDAVPIVDERRGSIRRRVVQVGGRELVALWRTTEQTTAQVSFLCKSLEDIEALLALPYHEPSPDVASFRERKRQVGENGLVVMGLGNALCFAHDILGPEFCCYLWAAHPAIVQEIVEIAAGRILKVVERACEQGVDCFRIYGGEYATQLMGPSAWEALVDPFDRQLVALMHAYGAIVHYHNHGMMDLWLERIADLGVDSLDPIEQPPYGDTPMEVAMARIGDRVCLVGGLDDMEILEQQPSHRVIEKGVDLLRSVGSVGFMLGGTSSGIYGPSAARNFLALVELVERLS